ncbi:luxR family transcriptional regulator [Mycobacteroides abscessus subsp. bolletii 1513]|uniref:LuxR family transcriptional regulator n=1 Tax=Mycobacteroides abscessus subsp. bolletii 1513 TaxID=1299321 RepID=X8DHE1_9MYCO|nr:luxR family transcriptional regulator [Mycobacteroides abscessus subsp. bolletii 1513]
MKVLVNGTAGSGKTFVLSRIREALGSAGTPAVNHVPEAAPGPNTGPFVIDDADSLTDRQLETLRAVVENDPAAIIVVAAAPRRNPALRALFQALERESPAITLGPVNATDIGRMSPLAAPFAEQIAAASGGVLALTTAAVERLGDPDPLQSALRAIDTRVDELLRRLSPMAQAAVLLMSLDPGIGASDVAAALALPDAADLVDGALASGLIAGRATSPLRPGCTVVPPGYSVRRGISIWNVHCCEPSSRWVLFLPTWPWHWWRTDCATWRLRGCYRIGQQPNPTP